MVDGLSELKHGWIRHVEKNRWSGLKKGRKEGIEERMEATNQKRMTSTDLRRMDGADLNMDGKQMIKMENRWLNIDRTD